jgi:hypothetical protein
MQTKERGCEVHGSAGFQPARVGILPPPALGRMPVLSGGNVATAQISIVHAS